MSEQAVDEALARLSALHPKIIDLSLGRIERLLGRLGDPQLRLPPVIHVAGTNGKGSTLAFLRAMAEAAGRRVHVYTSPHLVRFAERIRVAGEIIGEDRLLALIERVERANGGEPITFFEITTALAFLAFAETPADFTLLEVGLGGRLDATNVVPHPLATGVTRISIDHVQYLGDTIERIAAEKAGILKAGAPAVIGPQDEPRALATLAARAQAIGAPLDRHGVEWDWRLEGGELVVEGPGGADRTPLPSLPGRHQLANAATALRLARLIGLPAAARAAGVGAAAWPGRLQRLTRGPLVAAAGEGAELWLDGGHNDSAGRALAAWLAEQPRRRTLLIVGMLENKDAAAFLGPLAGLAESAVAVPIPRQPAAFAPEALARLAAEAGLASSATAVSPLAALEAHPGYERILIAGSLYLAGAVLAENG